jgi:hypothetical protein
VLPTHAVRDQGRTGLLHNIGKLAISNRILDKPGALTHAEYAQVKKHPGLSYEVLMRVAPFCAVGEVAASHHEKLDGTGYHRGMTAEELSVPSRILAVADVFDALSQDRPYRPAMPIEKVLTILKRAARGSPLRMSKHWRTWSRRVSSSRKSGVGKKDMILGASGVSPEGRISSRSSACAKTRDGAYPPCPVALRNDLANRSESVPFARE